MTSAAPSGYAHPGYAASLAEFGTPHALPASGGWVLERAIPGHAARDAMGCYPFLCCEDWRALPDDVAGLGERWVTLTAVTDPFGDYDAALLRAAFTHVRPFKEHFVADLGRPADAIVSRHHRYYARRALRALAVERHPDPPGFTDAWTALYAVLVRRYALDGLKAFSRAAFARQLAVPGMRLFVARRGDEVVGAQLWYVHGGVAYNHLQAASDLGYELGASYALYHTALGALADEVRWLHVGAGAGAAEAESAGLRRFKAGWATDVRPTYLCGRVLDPAAFAAICRATGRDAATSYFPPYRAGELVAGRSG